MIQKMSYFVLLAMLALTACNDDDDDFGIPEQDNMIEFASNQEDYSILVEAINISGLTPTIANTGPFTLFAPNNAAFEAYFNTVGISNIAELDRDTLGNVLTNHVIAGDFRTTTLQTGYYSTISAIPFDPNIPSLAYLSVEGGVRINGTALVTDADNRVENGVFQGVDQVAEPATIATFATLDPDFDSLEVALSRSDLSTDFVAELRKGGPYTVFAPNNGAFDTLLLNHPDWAAIEDIPAETLEKVLRLHVSSTENLRSNLLFNGRSINTLAEGESLVIDITSFSEPKVIASGNTTTFTILDIQAENGVIHVIDTVLLPEDL